ncbi:hypothetical protein [uncultured Gimesia sp.]|uniref:hypothetical protein n=1 Tax=uncultured Gimesia sp. TaxID=1678688 RepID=UPI00262E0FDF|nr:hypothetical protein [uncultured Gimesia sp.]
MNLLRITFVFFVLHSASAQEPDVTSSKMESTRQVFLAEVDDARLKVIAQLDNKIRNAQRTGVLETIERFTTEKEEFTNNGTNPSSVNMRVFQRKVSLALLALKRDFEDAIKKSVKQGKIEEAQSLRDELKTFEDSPLSRSNWGFAEYKVESGAGAWRPFTNGARAYTNRSYVWNKISPEWPLKQFAPLSVGRKQTQIKITVTSPGWVFIALSQGDQAQVSAYLTRHSWQPTPYAFSYISNGKTSMRIFRKQLLVGEHVILRYNFSGPVLLKP